MPSASGPDKTVRRQLLEEAADLIDGDRNHTYGSPTENFKNIAEMWNVRFKHMLADSKKFSASDVADAMIIVKVARGIAQKTHDTYADIAGYAGCGEEIRQDEEQFARGGIINIDTSRAVPSDEVRNALRHIHRGH